VGAPFNVLPQGATDLVAPLSIKPSIPVPVDGRPTQTRPDPYLIQPAGTGRVWIYPQISNT